MATVSAVIQKGNKKADGTWNVNIRLWHKGKAAFIDTIHYVAKNQVGPKSKGSTTLVIKDHYVLDRVAPDLKKYRDWISDNADLIERLSAKELKERLLKSDKPVGHDQIDFLKFCGSFIQSKIKSDKASSAKPLTTVYNSLVDYFGRTENVSITEINYNFLTQYEAYLISNRTLTRNKKGGGTRSFKRRGLNKAGLHNHMRDLRLLFNEARNHFNDENIGIILIPHYPFKKYKVGTPPLTEHRARPVEEVMRIMRVDVKPGSRAELARDLCRLSFFMVGMNAADIYELPSANKIGARYGYRRAKTRGKRRDEAFISIKVHQKALPLLTKYAGKLQIRYIEPNGLNKAIDKGLEEISRITGIPGIDFYDMRHCVGTWARRIAGFSKEDVAEALNQTERTVTDTYIAQDWSVVDRVQSAIIGLLYPMYGPELPQNLNKS